MRKHLVLLAGALLWPALAAAQSRYSAEDPETRFWLGVGLGGGSINSAAPAPSADRDVFAFNIDVGYRITPELGVGLEYGLVAPKGGCGGHRCTPAQPDFAPNFSHWFLIAEQRPGDGGVRLRIGAGVTSMCYRYYKSHKPWWQEFLEAAIFQDDNLDHSDSYWDCKSLHALGGVLSIGYQWPLADAGSVGLQLRADGANFAASRKAGTAAFRYRAVTLQLQMNLN